MPQKIGIFDPGFSTTGHFIPFDRYIAQLIGDEYELVFLDFGDRMRSAYENKISLKYEPSFVTIADVPVYPGRLTLRSFFLISWWRKRWNDFRWCARAFHNIEKLDLDLVIITSQSTPFIFLQRPRFPYCIVIQHPMLIKSRERLKGVSLIFAPIYDFFIRHYFSFLGRAKVVFTTNDPTMPSPFPGAVWLPTNLDLREFTPIKTVSKRKFMTIGVVSDAKNHTFALDAFEKFRLPFSYLIAGMPTDAVGEKVKERVLHFPNANVTGMFKNIPADEYESLIRESDYLILPYDFKMEARGASQVLYDAFRNHTPIVAPDFEPFRNYVERYGIGVLYKEGDADSFKHVLEKAANVSKDHFSDNFRHLYADFSFDKIKEDFSARIRSCL